MFAVFFFSDDGSDGFKIPYLGRGYLNYGTRYDWNVTSVPTESLGNKTIILPQARVLGGTSAINGMQFARGAPSDYDAWEELGNEGWNYKSLEKYFKKVQAISWRETLYQALTLHPCTYSPKTSRPHLRNYRRNLGSLMTSLRMDSRDLYTRVSQNFSGLK